jgi:tetratricopeptide (TPR) repeat protein
MLFALAGGAGSYVALGALAPDGWRTDLLELTALEKVDESTSPGSSRRPRRGKPKTRRPRSKPSTKPAAKPTEKPAAKQAASGNKAMAHYTAAMAHMKNKKIGLAIEELNKCIAADPSFAQAFRSLGIAQTLLGRERAATQAFERFVKLAPNHRDTPRIKQIIADYHRRNPK